MGELLQRQWCTREGWMFISRVLYLLVGTALSVTSLPTANYATVCSTEAWWIVHGLPKATVLSMLPPNCTLAPHGLSLPPNQHPIFLQFNHQGGCHENPIPVPAPDMLEFIVDIPFVIHPSQGGPLSIKSTVFVNQQLNAIGARAVYGLPATKQKMARTAWNASSGNSTYSVSHGGGIDAVFSPQGGWTHSNAVFKDTFQRINAEPWLCRPLLSAHEQCAFNYFDWSAAALQVRPVVASITVREGAIQGFPAVHWNNTSMLAFQLSTKLYITGAQSCPN